jgi:hypothetical protein
VSWLLFWQIVILMVIAMILTVMASGAVRGEKKEGR